SPLVATLHPDLSMQSSLIGVLLGGGFLYFVAWLYWIIRKEYGMGFGDVKLLAGIGGWLGYESLFQTVFIGSIIGSIIGILALAIGRQFSWQAKLPFGPFLATGATIWLFRNFF
ncbi:MAG: prepilin peptidase, partial [Proteobacteria bacterium]|nr:prepilin peptidase [Pseudomonadota bacterium]